MPTFVAGAWYAYVVAGLINVVFGSVMPDLLAHYHAAYAAGGQLVFAQFIGFMAGVPAASFAHRFGHRHTLALAAATVGVCQFALGVLPPFPLLYPAAFISGLGVALTETAVATHIMEAYPGRRAVVMSRLEVAFGLGSFLMPSVTSFLIARSVWRDAFFLTAVMEIGLAVVWLLTRAQRIAGESGARDRESAPPPALTTAGRRAALILFMIMIFVYVGVENSLSGFMPALFIPYVHVTPAVASLAVTVFWGAMVAGRAVTGRLMRHVSYRPFLLVSCSLTLGAVVAMAVVPNAYVVYALAAAAGVFMSGIFAITLVFANHSLHGDERRVTSLLTLCAGVGGATLPAVVGYVMDREPPAPSILVIAGYAALMVICLLAAVRVNARMQKAPAHREV